MTNNKLSPQVIVFDDKAKAEDQVDISYACGRCPPGETMLTDNVSLQAFKKTKLDSEETTSVISE